jgi:uncharacterized repeat protein (TIGR03803 family)
MSRINQLFPSVFGMDRRASLAALPSLLIVLSCLSANPHAQAQTFTALHSFAGSEGVFPTFGLVRDSSGNLYGATQYGGLYQNCDNELGGGAIYKVDPSGKTTTLHAFNNGLDSCFPSSPLVLDNAGNLYGTTYGNSVFKIDSAGNLTTLFLFLSQAEGREPIGTLSRDSQGNLYGTTLSGGNNGCQYNLGCGTVFKLDASGKETVLYAFQGGADGFSPQAGVIRDSAGNLYSTTTYGGNLSCQNGCGVVFKIDTTGKQTVLHTFSGGADGRWPSYPLVRDSGGNLYGVTGYGGDLSCSPPHGCGTVYKITPSGKKSILYSFKGGNDGSFPDGGLTLDAAGNFYGTTSGGGSTYNAGTVYKLDKSGNVTILHSFTTIDAGTNPGAGVIRDAQDNLYGTTEYGGHLGQGVVYKLVP